MKNRLLTLLFTVMLFLGAITPVFSDTFVPSIAQRHEITIADERAVVLDGGASSLTYQEEDGCFTEIIVTPYSYKDTIESNESRYLIDVAYGEIVKIPTVEELDKEEIDAKAKEVGVDPDNLVVRDLFDITLYHRGQVPAHKEDLHVQYIELTLKTQTLENFVCLLHYKDGAWNIVDSARVVIDENHLYLSIDELSPFAIVVSTEEVEPGVPSHGCCIWHWFILITCLITFIIAQFIKRNDNDSEKNKEEIEQLDSYDTYRRYEKEEKANKRKVAFRDIMSLVNLILCVIFYILGSCKWDIYALILDIIILIIIFLYSHPKEKKHDNEEEGNN